MSYLTFGALEALRVPQLARPGSVCPDGYVSGLQHALALHTPVLVGPLLAMLIVVMMMVIVSTGLASNKVGNDCTFMFSLWGLGSVVVVARRG